MIIVNIRSWLLAQSSSATVQVDERCREFVFPIARAAPRARQGALLTGLRVAVHQLGPLLLCPKETCQVTGLGRARNGQDQNEDQRGTGNMDAATF